MSQSVATLVATSTAGITACLAGAAGGICLFIRGLGRTLRRKTTPPSKLPKTPLGPIDVSGAAAGPYTVNAPITETACFAYRTVAWRQTQTKSGNSEAIVAEEKLHIPFFLEDTTGKVLVDPTGAEFDLRQDFRHEFQNSSIPDENPTLKNVRSFLKRHGVPEGGRLRVEECCIKPSSFLFVHGTLAKNPGLVIAPQTLPEQKRHGKESSMLESPRPESTALESSTLESMISTLNSFPAEFPVPAIGKTDAKVPTGDLPHVLRDLVDLTSALPVAESSREMTQQGKIAAALQRAGIIMPDIRALMIESDEGNGAAVEKTPGQASNAGNGGLEEAEAKIEFDLKPPLILAKGKPTDRFVISWRDQRRATRMRWQTAAMLWGGPALTLLSLSLLAAQLGWL